MLTTSNLHPVIHHVTEFGNAVQVQMAEVEVGAAAPQQVPQCLAWQPLWKAVAAWRGVMQVILAAAGQKHA